MKLKTNLLMSILFIFFIFFQINLIYGQDYTYKLNLHSENKIKCNISKDNDFSEEKIKNSEIFKGEIKKSLNISCNKSLERYDLKIFQDNTLIKHIKDNAYVTYFVKKRKIKNIQNINFELNSKTLKTNNLKNCTINKDGNKKQLESKEIFLNKFEIICKDKQQIEIYIQNNNFTFYDKIYSDKFNYNSKSKSKPYLIDFYFYDKWNKTNKCVLKTNSGKKEKQFNNELHLKDYNLTLNGDKYLKLNCENNIDTIYLNIINRKWPNSDYTKIYKNTSNINLNLSKITYDYGLFIENKTKKINSNIPKQENKSVIIQKKETNNIVKPKKLENNKINLSNKNKMCEFNLIKFPIIL